MPRGLRGAHDSRRNAPSRRPVSRPPSLGLAHSTSTLVHPRRSPRVSAGFARLQHPDGHLDPPPLAPREGSSASAMVQAPSPPRSMRRAGVSGSRFQEPPTPAANPRLVRRHERRSEQPSSTGPLVDVSVSECLVTRSAHLFANSTANAAAPSRRMGTPFVFTPAAAVLSSFEP